jgi:hypothetical protein
MGDDWSLKDKKAILKSAVREHDIETVMYKEKDIETLREKLIEDIQTIYPEFKYGEPYQKIIKVIYKRFGVE